MAPVIYKLTFYILCIIIQRPKNNFGVTGDNFDLNYLRYFKMDFKNFSAYHVANLKLTQLLYFGRVEADKIAKSKVGSIFWDTLYNEKLSFH